MFYRGFKGCRSFLESLLGRLAFALLGCKKCSWCWFVIYVLAAALVVLRKFRQFSMRFMQICTVVVRVLEVGW